MAAVCVAEVAVIARSVKSSESVVAKSVHAVAQETGRVHRKVQTLSCYIYLLVSHQ